MGKIQSEFGFDINRQIHLVIEEDEPECPAPLLPHQPNDGAKLDEIGKRSCIELICRPITNRTMGGYLNLRRNEF